MRSHSTLTRSSRCGFTLIEVVVVIAIFTILAGLGLFMGMETFRGTLHRSEVGTIVALLEKARSRAMANVDQRAWTVCYDSSYEEYVITKESSCDDSTAYDRVEKREAVTVTFPNVRFAQLSGKTDSPPGPVVYPIAITVEEGGRPDATININEQGTIIW